LEKEARGSDLFELVFCTSTRVGYVRITVSTGPAVAPTGLTEFGSNCTKGVVVGFKTILGTVACKRIEKENTQECDQ